MIPTHPPPSETSYVDGPLATNVLCQRPRIELAVMPEERDAVEAAVALAEAFKEQMIGADPARAMGEEEG